MGETDISSMSKLIKSPGRFLYWGSDIAKDWGGWRGREGLWACNAEVEGVEATGSKCLLQRLVWAENENLGRSMLPTPGAGASGLGGKPGHDYVDGGEGVHLGYRCL